MHGKHENQGFRNKPSFLTERQIEILNWVKLGLTDAEISKKLSITTSTVSVAVIRGIFSRLNARNRAHAVYIAMKRKIIS